MSSKSIVLDQDVVVTHLQGKIYLVAADGSRGYHLHPEPEQVSR